MKDQHSFGECLSSGLRRGLTGARTTNEMREQSILDKDGLLSSDHICVAIAEALAYAGYKQL